MRECRAVREESFTACSSSKWRGVYPFGARRSSARSENYRRGLLSFSLSLSDRSWRSSENESPIINKVCANQARDTAIPPSQSRRARVVGSR